MNARTIRRAQERQARNEAVKDFKAAADISPAQLNANRANAQLSTGSRTDSGKVTSSLNAVKTGLTGKTVLLPSDNAAQYETHLRRFVDEWQPATDRETELVQSLSDTQWRINRIPSLELGIYALARIEFAEKFQDYEPAEAAILMQAQAFITYHKQLNNLSLQDSRLRRQFQTELKELLKLQMERQQSGSKTLSRPDRPTPENGFEFSPLENHQFNGRIPVLAATQG